MSFSSHIKSFHHFPWRYIFWIAHCYYSMGITLFKAILDNSLTCFCSITFAIILRIKYISNFPWIKSQLIHYTLYVIFCHHLHMRCNSTYSNWTSPFIPFNKIKSPSLNVLIAFSTLYKTGIFISLASIPKCSKGEPFSIYLLSITLFLMVIFYT